MKKQVNRLIRDNYLRSWAVVFLCAAILFSFPSSGQADVLLDNIDDEIAYLDADGKICVLDPSVAEVSEITWCSPEDGFIAVTAGDVNVDGDAELIGFSLKDEAGELVVYDPVISDDRTPDGWINDVPWAELARIAISGTVSEPVILSAGELDAAVPGDEILYAFDTAQSGSLLSVLKADNLTPDGTSWIPHISEIQFAQEWTSLSIADLNYESEDEVVLVGNNQSDASELHAYQIADGGLANKAPFLRKASTTANWIAAAAGDINSQSPGEIVAILDNDSGSENIQMIHFVLGNDGSLTEDQSASQEELVDPHAEALFLADLTGIVNNVRDYETVFLRSVAASENRARLFVRNDGPDAFDESRFDLSLNSDNGWLAGVGGDVDGDVQEEIIIVREDRIRIYNEPNDSLETTDYADITTIADLGPQMILAANLDANGFAQATELSATISGLENGLLADSTGQVQIQVGANGRAVPVTARLDSPPAWATGLSPTSGETPATFAFSVDATGLTPRSYTVNVVIESDDPAIQNSPLELAVEVPVLDTAINITPGIASVVNFPCQTTPAAITTEIEVGGTSRTGYTAFVLPTDAVSAALSQLDGGLLNAAMEDGQLILRDGSGKTSTLQVDQQQSVQSSANPPGITWYSSVPWVAAESVSAQTDDTLSITVNTGELETSNRIMAEATLVIVADDQVVSAPYNTYFVPIHYLCAQGQVLLPLVNR